MTESNARAVFTALRWSLLSSVCYGAPPPEIDEVEMKGSVAYCHIVASILAADGMMEENERRFLTETMDRLELTDDERDDVVHFENSEGAEEAVKALPREEREALRDDLLSATLADGKITALESHAVEHITKLLDL